MLKKSVSAMMSPLCRNLERLSGADFVGVAQHVAISLENLRVFVGIAYTPLLILERLSPLAKSFQNRARRHGREKVRERELLPKDFTYVGNHA
jgi:hypothetical protein